MCRVVFSQPEVSDLRPAPFKQLGLWESDNGVNVPKKLLEWKKHGGLFGGKDEFLPPTVCVCCNAKQPAAVLSCLCGAEPHDFIEVVESAFKLGSWRTVLQQRPDIAAYISELALVDYKNSIMATVRSVALNDPEVEKWWATFLTHKIRSRVGYVVGKETPMFSWPRKFRAGSLSPTTSQNVAPRDGGAGGYENCSSTASIVASHTLPVMVQTLSFSGHGKSFISNRLTEHGLRDAASVRRGERLATTPPDLAKNAFVWVRVAGGSDDSCVFHLGQVREEWKSPDQLSGQSVGDLWSGEVSKVSIRWVYRKKKGDYNSNFTFLVNGEGKAYGFDMVVRESIEVDSLEMKQGGGNKSTSPYTLTKAAIQKIVDAGIGFKLDGRTTTKMVYEKNDDPCGWGSDSEEAVSVGRRGLGGEAGGGGTAATTAFVAGDGNARHRVDGLLDQLIGEDATYVDGYLRDACDAVAAGPSSLSKPVLTVTFGALYGGPRRNRRATIPDTVAVFLRISRDVRTNSSLMMSSSTFLFNFCNSGMSASVQLQQEHRRRGGREWGDRFGVYHPTSTTVMIYGSPTPKRLSRRKNHKTPISRISAYFSRSTRMATTGF